MPRSMRRWDKKRLGGQSQVEAKEWEQAEELFPGRHKSANFYVGARKFRQAVLAAVVEDGQWKGLSGWDGITKAFLKHGDFSHPQVTKHTQHCVASAFDIYSALGGHPQQMMVTIDILLLMIPHSAPLGVCDLTPDGVSSLCRTITGKETARLMQPLGSTETWNKMKEGGKLTKEKEKLLAKKKASAAKRREKAKERYRQEAAAAKEAQSRRPPGKFCRTSAVKEALQKRQQAKAAEQEASGDLQLYDTMGDLEILQQHDAEQSILTHIITTKRDMIKRDASQEDHLESAAPVILQRCSAGEGKGVGFNRKHCHTFSSSKSWCQNAFKT